MIALYDFMPNFCPNCGTPIMTAPTPEAKRYAVQDFHARCSFSCSNCKVSYQYVSTDALRETAKKDGGDLADYH